MLAGVFFSVLLLTGLGGCVEDFGGPARAEIVGNTFPAIDPASVEVKDLIPAGGNSVSPATISNYESSLKGIKVAQIAATVTGSGDETQKVLDKIKNKAAKLGANLILITDKRNLGYNGVTITTEAYHTTK